MQDYRNLKVWQQAMSLVEDVYQLTASLPTKESFGLQSQARRSSVSIPSNIAEGSARSSDAEFSRFVRIALGSLAELQTQIELLVRLNFVQPDTASPVIKQADDLGVRLRNLNQRLQSQAKQSQS